MQVEGQGRLAEYLKQVECGNTTRSDSKTSGSGSETTDSEVNLEASSEQSEHDEPTGRNTIRKLKAREVLTELREGDSRNNQRILGEAEHTINKQKPAQRLAVTSGISCLTKDGEIADCSQDPAMVKQAIKLIEKSPHPRAAARKIRGSNRGKHGHSRKRARRSRGGTAELEKQVKDLKAKLIKMEETQRAASKSQKLRNNASCTVAKICDRLKNGFSKDVLKAECLMH